MTLDAVGQVMGVTRERVRQLEKDALYKIGRRLRHRWSIDDVRAVISAMSDRRD